MYKINNYPDGGKYITIEQEFESLTYKINTYEDLFLMKSIKDANPHWKEVTIPCMFQQQHDRKFKPNESFELKLVCEFINSLEFEKVKIFHPHSDVTPALINNCEVIDNIGFIREVLDDINNDNLILFSSDAGGFKPLIKLCNEINWQGETYAASKARQRDKLTQVIDRKDFEGKDILIIDDICVYGGTFKGLSKMLKERNCGKLYLAVSHITVEDIGTDPVTNYFDKVYSTNSKYDEYCSDGNYSFVGNLEIINLF